MSVSRIIINSSLAATVVVPGATASDAPVVFIEDSLFQNMVSEGIITEDPRSGGYVVGVRDLEHEIFLPEYLMELKEITGEESMVQVESIENMSLSTQEGIPEI